MMIVDEYGSGIFAFVPQDGFVFVIEDESNPNTHKQRGQMSLPMGHERPGEDALGCILREFEEETNHELSLRSGSVRMVGRIFLCKQDGRFARITMFTGIAEMRQPASSMNGHVLITDFSNVLAMPDISVRPPTKQAIQRLLATNPSSRLSWMDFGDLVVD